MATWFVIYILQQERNYKKFANVLCGQSFLLYGRYTWTFKNITLVCLHALHNWIVCLHELSQTLVPKLLLAISWYSLAGVDHIFLKTSPGQGCSCAYIIKVTVPLIPVTEDTAHFNFACVWHTQNWELLPTTHLLCWSAKTNPDTIIGRIWKFKKFCLSWPQEIFILLQCITICNFSFVSASLSIKCH